MSLTNLHYFWINRSILHGSSLTIPQNDGLSLSFWLRLSLLSWVQLLSLNHQKGIENGAIHDPSNSIKKHKNQIFSKARGSFVLFFTFLEFAHIDLPYFVEKPDGIFFLAKIQLTGPVYFWPINCLSTQNSNTSIKALLQPLLSLFLAHQLSQHPKQ